MWCSESDKELSASTGPGGSPRNPSCDSAGERTQDTGLLMELDGSSGVVSCIWSWRGVVRLSQGDSLGGQYEQEAFLMPGLLNGDWKNEGKLLMLFMNAFDDEVLAS